MKQIFTLLLTFSLPTILSAQTISAITPNQAVQGQTLSLAITGQSTTFSQGTSTTSAWMQQGGNIIYFTTLNVMNDVLLTGTATVSNSDPTGLYDVQVYNSNYGLLNLSSGFEVLANPNLPIIVTVDPDTGYRDDMNLAVTITGQNTNFAQGSNTIWFTQGTSTVLYPFNVTANSNTETVGYFNIPNNQPLGLYDVHVYDTPDGELIKPLAFNILQSIGVETANAGALNFEAYPNPLDETLTLDFSLKAEEHVFIDLYDVSGKRLSVLVDKRFGQGEYKEQVQLSKLNLQSGIYFVRMKSGVKERILQVVKK